MLQKKLKYRILGSYLISDEKKTELLHELPNFSIEQQKLLIRAISEAERKANPLLQRGLQNKNGRLFLFKLQGLCKKLKKETFSLMEKGENEKTLTDINSQLYSL